MKKIVLLIVLCTVFLSANAQLRPVIEKGKTWAKFSCSYSLKLDEWTSTWTYLVGGNTVVNHIRYKTIYASSREDLSDAQPYFYAREDNGKIYLLHQKTKYDEEDPKEFLYFDYNAKIGEKMILGYEECDYGYCEAEITAVDTVVLSGSDVPLTRFTVKTSYLGTLYFYEGIGYEIHGVDPFIFEKIIGGESFLICCHDGEGTQLYGFRCDSGKYLPVSGRCYFDASMLEDISTPTAEPVDSVKRIYNIDGRKLPSRPERGVYIENGKKRMAR